MNGISGGDLEYLKDGLRMDGDSVVDLDRSSMIDVVKKAGVDLESPQFANLDGLGGDFSTASAKLSRFFNEESDPRKIASVISELLDVRVARATIQNLDQQLIAEVSYQKSRAIVERLSARHIGNGRAPVTLNDDDFEYQHAWEPGYRIFISHSSVDSNLAGQFKKSLRAYGFAAFLAHDDIDAPDHWPVVIEHALSSAHAVAPLLSENFNDSFWPNQEIGFAYAHGKEFFPIAMGELPEGLIRNSQAFRYQPQHVRNSFDGIALRIVNKIIHDPFVVTSLVNAVNPHSTFAHNDGLSEFLHDVDGVTQEQCEELVGKFNAPPRRSTQYNQVRGSSFNQICDHDSDESIRMLCIVNRHATNTYTVVGEGHCARLEIVATTDEELVRLGESYRHTD